MIEENPLEVRFTKLTEGHLDWVMKVEPRIFASPWTKKGYLACLNTPSVFSIVADTPREDGSEDRKMVGWYVLQVVLDESHLLTFAIDPVFQGLGLGRRMLKHCFEMAKMKGAKIMILDVRLSNHVAVHLYESVGFIPLYVRKKYYSDGEDSVVMKCHLEKSVDGQ